MIGDKDPGIVHKDGALHFEGMSFKTDGSVEDAVRLINEHSKLRVAKLMAGDVWIMPKDMGDIAPELEGALSPDLDPDELKAAVVAQLKAVQERTARHAAQTNLHAEQVGIEDKKLLEAQIQKHGACFKCFDRGKASPISAWAPASNMCDTHVQEEKERVARRYGARPFDADEEARNRIKVARRKKANRAKSKAARRARKRRK